MPAKRRYLSIFQDIHRSCEYHKLENYRNPRQWKAMSEEEKLLLAELFLKQAKQKFLQGEGSTEIFDLVQELAGEKPDIFLTQGSILLDHALNSQEYHHLDLAKQKFEQAIELHPTLCQAWHSLGVTLSNFAHVNQDFEAFAEAQLKFEKAYSLSTAIEQKILFNSEWGKSLLLLGKLSGEALDYKKSIEKFQEAYELGARSVTFLNDFGLALLDIAPLINSADALINAIELFALAAKQDSQSAISWYHLGISFQKLYGLLSKEDLFFKAHEYFQITSELQPNDAETWYHWGLLLLEYGNLNFDPNYIADASEKLLEAIVLNDNHILAHCALVKCYLLLGDCDDDISFLKIAKDRISDLNLRFENNVEVAYCHGLVLISFGRYFADSKYYIEAISIFQNALTIDNTYAFLWHGLSEATFELGLLQNNLSLFEKAAYYCSLAIRSKNSNPQFWSDWGICLLKLAEVSGQPQFIEDAIEKLEKAIRLRGGVEETPDLECLYHLGYAYDLLGDQKVEITYYKKAITLFSHILEIDPEYSQTRYHLAIALSQVGELTYDIDYFRHSIEQFRLLTSDHGEDEIVFCEWGITLLNLACLLNDINHQEHNQKILNEAEQKLLKAVELGNTQALYYLACYYSLIEQYDPSMHFLLRALNYKALPSIEEMQQDVWLEGLRQTEAFRQFISQLRKSR